MSSTTTNMPEELDCEDCGRTLCTDCDTHFCIGDCPCGHLHTCDCVCGEYAESLNTCWCGHLKDRHWSGATNMTFPDGCHDCPGWNGAHAYGQELPWLPDSE
jgi:hypothetical protein